MSIYGYYTDYSQTQPVFDPGLDVLCPICGHTLKADDIRTISLAVPDDVKSYFYRVHKSCHEPLNEAQRAQVDGLLIDAIYSTRNTN